MEARERENERRVARGWAPLKMPEAWSSRPKLNVPEAEVFSEFRRFHRACGGNCKLTEMQAWFAMRGVAQAEQGWMAQLFGALAHAWKEDADGGS